AGHSPRGGYGGGRYTFRTPRLRDLKLNRRFIRSPITCGPGGRAVLESKFNAVGSHISPPVRTPRPGRPPRSTGLPSAHRFLTGLNALAGEGTGSLTRYGAVFRFPVGHGRS